MTRSSARLSMEQALQKARHYCAYQERSHAEVRQKLYAFGLRKAEVEEIMAQLIGEDLLNESRFAIQFAGGKFRIKKWGKIKITYELKLKQVSPYNLRLALAEIEPEEYEKVLENLALAKWKSLRGVPHFSRQARTLQYLRQKGFEPGLAQTAVKRLQQD
jgi:regulatory protein